MSEDQRLSLPPIADATYGEMSSKCTFLDRQTANAAAFFKVHMDRFRGDLSLADTEPKDAGSFSVRENARSE